MSNCHNVITALISCYLWIVVVSVSISEIYHAVYCTSFSVTFLSLISWLGCSNEVKMHAAMRKKPVITSNSSQVSIPVPAHQPSKTGNTMKKWGKNKGRTILSACCLQGELLWMWTRGVVTLQQCGSCYWVIAVYKLFLLKLPMCIPNVDVKIVKCWEHSCEEQWVFANTPFFIN